MSRRNPTFADLPPLLQLLIVIFLVVAVFWSLFGSRLVSWWSTNWWWIVLIIVVVILAGIYFFIKVLLPINEEATKKTEREDALQRSIIRKRLLTKRGKELEGLSEEEKEYQVSKWVEDELTNNVLGKNSKHSKQYVVPPLTGKFTARFINSIGNRCENPNCRNDYGLHVHHIHPRSEGGSNELSNLIALCPTDHTKAHRGAFSRDLLREWAKHPRRFRFRI